MLLEGKLADRLEMNTTRIVVTQQAPRLGSHFEKGIVIVPLLTARDFVVASRSSDHPSQ